jgi:hypothetical protein
LSEFIHIFDDTLVVSDLYGIVIDLFHGNHEVFEGNDQSVVGWTSNELQGSDIVWPDWY